jgi:hypothetical protein
LGLPEESDFLNVTAIDCLRAYPAATIIYLRAARVPTPPSIRPASAETVGVASVVMAAGTNIIASPAGSKGRSTDLTAPREKHIGIQVVATVKQDNGNRLSFRGSFISRGVTSPRRRADRPADDEDIH